LLLWSLQRVVVVLFVLNEAGNHIHRSGFHKSFGKREIAVALRTAANAR
jgi:hypothetical protein